MSTSEEPSASAEERPTPHADFGEKGFLEERPGHQSAMRAMSAVALLCAVGFGVFTLAEPTVGREGTYVTLAFLIAAFAPKAIQKFAEDAMLG